MNPRAAINDLLPFQGSPFDLLGISPKAQILNQYSESLRRTDRKRIHDEVLDEVLTEAERMGFEPMRPFGQTVFKTAPL